MNADRAIELLGQAAAGVVTFDDEFQEAAKIGQKGLILLTKDKGHPLDKLSQKLILGVTDDAETD